MNKSIAFIICVFQLQFVCAQTTFPQIVDSSFSKNVLSFQGNIDITSSSFRKEMVNSLLFGGEISEEMKNRSLKSHHAVNRVGVYAIGELNYVAGKQELIKKGGYTWQVKAGYYAIGNMNYSKDAYRLLFYGNSHLSNDTADFSNLKLNFVQFQKIGFGLFHKKSGSSLTLNLVSVQNQFDGRLRKGLWTQTPSGDQISTELHGTFGASQSKAFMKGIGFSFDFDYNFQVPWGKDSTTFQLSLQNVGAAYMLIPQTIYSAQSTFQYNGFTLNQIKNSSNILGGDFSVLDTLGITKSEKNKWILLPMQFQLAKLIELDNAKKVQSFFGVKFYPTIAVIPSIFAGIYYRFVPAFSVSANICYGGSSILRGGLFFNYHYKNITAQLGTVDVYGLVSRKGFGQSALIRLSWRF